MASSKKKKRQRRNNLAETAKQLAAKYRTPEIVNEIYTLLVSSAAQNMPQRDSIINAAKLARHYRRERRREQARAFEDMVRESEHLPMGNR